MSLYAHNLHLTSPPPTHGSRVGQTSIPAVWTVNQPALTIYLPCIYIIYRLITPIKPVYSEPLSVTVPVVICTCRVLVGTVESVPVPYRNLGNDFQDTGTPSSTTGPTVCCCVSPLFPRKPLEYEYHSIVLPTSIRVWYGSVRCC